MTELTYVLIPGAGGSAWYWHLLVDELHRRGRDSIAVELPAADDGAGFEEYADTVVDAVAGCGADRELVVVAQSMGGFTGALVCERLPVRMLVLLNAMTPTAGETGGEWWVNTGHEAARREQAAREGRPPESLGDLFDAFFHEVAADVTAEAVAQGDPAQSSTPFDRPWRLAAWPDVPTRFLQGSDDRFFPVEFQRRVVRERLGIAVDEIPGGHLVALSRPCELADALESYVAADGVRGAARPAATGGGNSV